MAVTKSQARIRDMLLQAGLVDDLQLRSALAHMEQWGGRLPAALVTLRFADEERVVQALSAGLGLPVVHLGQLHRDAPLLRLFDPAWLEEHAVYPMLLRDRVLTAAMADPTDVAAIDELAARSNARVQPALAAESEILAAVQRNYYGKQGHKSGTRAGGAGGLSDSIGAGPLFELDTSEPPPPVESRGTPAPFSSPSGQHPSANTLLDELMDAPAGDFTEDELRRLEEVKLNQQKVGAVVRAVQELLAERGLL